MNLKNVLKLFWITGGRYLKAAASAAAAVPASHKTSAAAVSAAAAQAQETMVTQEHIHS